MSSNFSESFFSLNVGNHVFKRKQKGENVSLQLSYFYDASFQYLLPGQFSQKATIIYFLKNCLFYACVKYINDCNFVPVVRYMNKGSR